MIIARRTVQNALVFSSLALVVMACGKSGDKAGAGGAASSSATVTSGPVPKGGSCNLEKDGMCHEYADSALGMVEGLCTGMMKGTYAKASCSTANLMGVCEEKDEKKYYYYGNADAPWVADAKEHCEKNAGAPGKWTAQPGAEEIAKTKALPAADKIGGSCTKESGSCDDVWGQMMDLQKGSCEAVDGKWATTPCQVDKLVASCVKNGKVTRYTDKDLKTQGGKLSDLQELCEKVSFPFGHFYPGPNAPAAGGAAAAGGAKAAAGGGAAKAAAPTNGGGGAAKAKKKP